MGVRKLFIGALAFVLACGESHTIGDGGPGSDAGRRDGSVSDAPGDSGACRGFPAPCHPDLGAGCCGAPTMPECIRGAWLCPPGTVGAESCRSFEPCMRPRCEGFSEIECLNVEGCVPVYDDACCPSCDPVGFCADCVDIEYERCDPIDAACTGPGCGLVPDWMCGGPEDCSRAFPLGEGAHCSIAGCVKVSEPGCGDECAFCEPARAEMCQAFCFLDPPPCPAGWVPQADGMCFTGLCIYAELCAPPEG